MVCCDRRVSCGLPCTAFEVVVTCPLWQLQCLSAQSYCARCCSVQVAQKKTKY